MARRTASGVWPLQPLRPAQDFRLRVLLSLYTHAPVKHAFCATTGTPSSCVLMLIFRPGFCLSRILHPEESPSSSRLSQARAWLSPESLPQPAIAPQCHVPGKPRRHDPCDPDSARTLWIPACAETAESLPLVGIGRGPSTPLATPLQGLFMGDFQAICNDFRSATSGRPSSKVRGYTIRAAA